MLNEEIRHPLDNGGANYRHKFIAEFDSKTYKRIYPNVPIRGKLVVSNDEERLQFIDFAPEVRTRNKLVYKSAHFSVRITDDGGYSITSHFPAKDALTQAGKKRYIGEFLRMLTFMSNPKEYE